MATKIAQMEERVRKLESDLLELKQASAKVQTLPPHRQVLGEFKNDQVFEEIVRLGKELRDNERSPKQIRPKLTTRRKGA